MYVRRLKDILLLKVVVAALQYCRTNCVDYATAKSAVSTAEEPRPTTILHTTQDNADDFPQLPLPTPTDSQRKNPGRTHQKRRETEDKHPQAPGVSFLTSKIAQPLRSSLVPLSASVAQCIHINLGFIGPLISFYSG